ncbi:EboA domain-containing protein [Leptospira jelokensis]|uniref:Uncharacterized protein n=1 Tax=Leptospira jelokensis TaxID=2484931 RepID=A0A4Z0ZXA8_9LEPT|nr:EboA domain-containing protein [Leptospira jelokensis]TGL75646.1 hypothetical protein EHQ62_02115 [Leptospira jelokensis]
MHSQFSEHFLPLLQKITTESEWEWIQSVSHLETKGLMTAFVKAPRFLSKTTIQNSVASENLIPSLPGFQVNGWDLVRLSRVWFLTHFASLTKDEFANIIDTLFDTAELNELIALYSALPLLPYPNLWLARAIDAVRSNMGSVFDAIAICNPYPFHHFPELAWNQLVLKTIFNEKPIFSIYGLGKRRNKELSLSIIDYAKERWAASRTVPFQVWYLVSPFLKKEEFSIIEKLLGSKHEGEVVAACLILFESNHNEAKDLLRKYPKYEIEIQNGNLNWSNLYV